MNKISSMSKEDIIDKETYAEEIVLDL